METPIDTGLQIHNTPLLVGHETHKVYVVRGDVRCATCFLREWTGHREPEKGKDDIE